MKKLAVANGTYQKDGQEKTRWVNIGIINTKSDGKEYMLLDPTINLAGFQREAGRDMLMVGIFEEQQNNGQQSYNNNNQQQNNQQPQGQYQPPAQQQQYQPQGQGNYQGNQ